MKTGIAGLLAAAACAITAASTHHHAMRAHLLGVAVAAAVFGAWCWVADRRKARKTGGQERNGGGSEQRQPWARYYPSGRR